MSKYKINNLCPLSKESRVCLYTDALRVSFQSWTDEIRSGDSSRTRSQMPIGKSIDLCLAAERPHLTVLYRECVYGENPPYFEFGLSSMGRPDYFVWINANVEESRKLFYKYGLTVFDTDGMQLASADWYVPKAKVRDVDAGKIWVLDADDMQTAAFAASSCTLVLKHGLGHTFKVGERFITTGFGIGGDNHAWAVNAVEGQTMLGSKIDLF